ncbi:MAG: class I SAM-dependent methyltransferase [Steroidobacteraceae bacterium]
MEAAQVEGIARQYLPSRWHYYYARSKLATDPLYAAVAEALAGTQAPLLDLGCGMGLMAHYCRARGVAFSYHGVDNDTAKIELARAAAARAGLSACRFDTLDLAQGIPAHQGSVALLDVLQFLPPEGMAVLIAQAAACVTDSGRLVIRTGLQDASWRTRVTKATDWFSSAIRWMNAAPRAYPTQAFLLEQLGAHGLEVQFSPLWGNTPFNNWLVVAQRPREPLHRFHGRDGEPFRAG